MAGLVSMDALYAKNWWSEPLHNQQGLRAPRHIPPAKLPAWPAHSCLDTCCNSPATQRRRSRSVLATATTAATSADPATPSRPPPLLRLSAETKQQQPPPPQSSLDAAQRRPSEDAGGDPTGPSPDPGPEPGQQPSGPGGPGGGLSFRLRYWILLLAEYGGIYGTIAVLIAAATNVDPFGGLHWDAANVALGLSLMAPALAFDAVVGLPDWTTKPEDAAALVRLFVDPELLQPHPKKQPPKADTTAAATAAVSHDDGEAVLGVSVTAAASAAPTLTSTATVASGSSTSSSTSDSSGGAGERRGALWAAGQRLRMALELMQESSVRNNPGARLTPLQEGVVIAVAVTADEMLYRAVLLTLFGGWLRDRFYEAGAEEALTLSPGAVLPGGLEADTAQWAALGLGVALGATAFAARAWREATMAQRLREMQAAEREVAAKALRKQRLLGQHVTEEEMREEREKQARLEAAQASLAASIGIQGALVWALEGSREAYQVAASGAAFILTGNLAAPIAGGLAAQVLVSAYQRLGLQRSMQRRAEVVARRRAELQRQPEVGPEVGTEATVLEHADGPKAGTEAPVLEHAEATQAGKHTEPAAPAQEGEQQQRQDP